MSLVIGISAKVTFPELIGYKKLSNGIICKLKISSNSARVCIGDRWRCAHAIVLEGDGASRYDPKFLYVVGQRVIANGFNSSESPYGCGIYFHLTREVAESYWR